jgi:hypothetical protein
LDVANTAAAPIGATNVKISFSSDGGNSFPTVLAASTPNDGAETISVPVGVTTQARIKVEAVGNVFFDLSDVNFQVTAAGGSQLSIADAVVMEGDSGTADVLVAVTLSPASSQVVSVTATTSSGTAASPGDYVHTQVPVTFGIGETLQFVSIPIVGDTQPEPHESFSVTLGSPAGATLADAVASVSVGNDDRPAADFDGNGISDVVVYRNGAWLFFNVPPGIRRPD